MEDSVTRTSPDPEVEAELVKESNHLMKHDKNSLGKMTVVQLRDELQKRGGKISGNKPELIARLLNLIESNVPVDEGFVV